ncbi:MAG: amino acid ABC transporter permease [Phycisphaerales bacterium]|nr:amino acid ABC transporter permease [Phycisphaerales bacterium]
MADTTLAPRPDELPPIRARGPMAWLRHNLFRTWLQSAMTLAMGGLLALAAQPLIAWAILNARTGTTPASCAGAEGACWSFVAANFQLFMVGTYPFEQRWRPLSALAVLVVLVVAMAWRRVRRWRPIYAVWALGIGLIYGLLRGGALGLPTVESAQWGGLLLTLILSFTAIAVAFPLGVLLALGRQSRTMPAVKALSIGFIELIRGVPLISVLFLAAIMVPLFLPSGVTVDNLLRAQVGIILFQSAYLAEVVRGGLQAVPGGQDEAARALGLSYALRMRRVILPQALRIVIPALVNQFIIILKDTTLVVVIGMFDLMGIAEVAIRNPTWLGRNFEAYAFVAAIYWVICFSMSRLSLDLERRLKVARL